MKLLDQVHEAARLRHLSPRTEKAYASWIRRFVLFHGTRHSRELGAAELRAFLAHLAVERNAAASTQNQALAALLFLYRRVLNLPLADLGQVERAASRRVCRWCSPARKHCLVVRRGKGAKGRNPLLRNRMGAVLASVAPL